jgi:murein DD-endopeptidase MepM/ murein hydrolase activator NlpD
LDRRALLLAGAATTFARPAWAGTLPLVLNGSLQQGGFAFGRTTPRAALSLDGVSVGTASGRGLFVVGFDRDSPLSATLSIHAPEGSIERKLTITPGHYDIQRIDGLPKDQVEPEDPVLLARIAAEAQRKAEGFASNLDDDDFRDGFSMPVAGARLSARFGGQRILNGDPKRPHYGTDLAAPIGTPVHAPAPGTVSFAETGLHFEGALILIDHGQGLISAYLHLSRIDVKAGDRVERGQVIGAVGREGRATGPHLCWRMKWRGRNMDPLLMVGVRAFPSEVGTGSHEGNATKQEL